jgi:hypothetical protein
METCTHSAVSQWVELPIRAARVRGRRLAGETSGLDLLDASPAMLQRPADHATVWKVGCAGRRSGTPLGAVLLWTCGLVLAAGPLSAEAKRVALVIGNDSYQNAQVLSNARSDAKAVAKALESSGFSVTLKQDLTLKSMKEALRAFKAQVSGGDEALFYFSGHGVQFEGTNYLIPVDVVAQSEEQVADDSVGLQRVLDDLHDQKARFTLAIIDACRENPFKGAGRGLSRRGLAPVTAATGQMVLYSAGAGQEALDRLGPHAGEAALLLRKLNRPPEAVAVKLKSEPAAATAPQAAAQANSQVDAAVQGTWMQMVPNPKGKSTWYWEIRANGTYAFWSTGPGAVAPHSGTLLAGEGKWAMNSPSWVDGGTYQVPNTNTLVANGRLGTGFWHRRP